MGGGGRLAVLESAAQHGIKPAAARFISTASLFGLGASVTEPPSPPQTGFAIVFAGSCCADLDVRLRQNTHLNAPPWAKVKRNRPGHTENPDYRSGWWARH